VRTLPADSVRTTISYPWPTDAYRSSSSVSAVVPRTLQASWPFRPTDRIRERSARPSASQKGIRKTPDVALLPNLAVHENQGGACGAACPASAPGSAFGRPACRTRATRQDEQIKAGQPDTQNGCGPRSRPPRHPLSSSRPPRLGRATGVAARSATPNLDPATTHKGFSTYEDMDRAEERG
jgi:hypothetical protein